MKDLNSGKIDADVDVYVAPPFVFLPRVQADLNTKRYNVAAQNCWVGAGGALVGPSPGGGLDGADISGKALGSLGGDLGDDAVLDMFLKDGLPEGDGF